MERKVRNAMERIVMLLSVPQCEDNSSFFVKVFYMDSLPLY
jgi:hypothetical protein